MTDKRIVDLLQSAASLYNNPSFIQEDPISIPHSYNTLQDIEISGFWTALLSWGQRPVIIRNARHLFHLMDDAPYDFILHHQESDLKRFLDFRHRTFQPTDTLYFIHFFRWYYQQFDTLETAFLISGHALHPTTEHMLDHFHQLFFSLEDAPQRTRKHVPHPSGKSTCKRLNMFLRWMVRDDGKGVDFGLWKNIRPDQLVCPLDVHVERVARKLGLITRKQTDWQAAVELTANLRRIDPDDPVRFDFALFGLGVQERMA